MRSGFVARSTRSATAVASAPWGIAIATSSNASPSSYVHTGTPSITANDSMKRQPSGTRMPDVQWFVARPYVTPRYSTSSCAEATTSRRATGGSRAAISKPW